MVLENNLGIEQDEIRQYDILVIGGGPAAMIAATTAKSYNKDKKIVIIRPNKFALVPCAIPYIFGKTVGSSDKNLIPSSKITDSGVELEYDFIENIDLQAKVAFGKSGAKYGYDKLILATGSVPNVPQYLKGVQAQGVFAIPKDKEKLDELYAFLTNKEKIIVIGAGFIGMELAAELAQEGKDVSLIAKHDRVLHKAFDEEFAKDAQQQMEHCGVKLIFETKVEEILEQDGQVCGVKTSDGKIIETQVVILAIGYHPENELAKKIGLRIGKKGGIWVDEYMRTETKDIFAVGDCASKQHFLTRKTANIMLASTATAEARICAASLYKIGYIKGFSGTIAVFSTVIGSKAFASAGITEEDAQSESIDIVTGIFSGPDRHPANIKDCQNQTVKLIATKKGGVIIGGQVSGGVSIGELINVIGLIIENKMTIYSLLDLQIATHPLLSSAPTAYPIVKAAEMIDKKIS